MCSRCMRKNQWVMLILKRLSILSSIVLMFPFKHQIKWNFLSAQVAYDSLTQRGRPQNLWNTSPLKLALRQRQCWRMKGRVYSWTHHFYGKSWLRCASVPALTQSHGWAVPLAVLSRWPLTCEFVADRKRKSELLNDQEKREDKWKSKQESNEHEREQKWQEGLVTLQEVNIFLELFGMGQIRKAAVI